MIARTLTLLVGLGLIGAAGRHGLGRPGGPSPRRAPVVAEAAPFPEPPPAVAAEPEVAPEALVAPEAEPAAAPTVSAGRPATDAAGVTVHRGLD